jgi:hypothetical protein
MAQMLVEPEMAESYFDQLNTLNSDQEDAMAVLRARYAAVVDISDRPVSISKEASGVA